MFANILCSITERSCYEGREVAQTDEGAEEQDKEDPWCEEGQYQSVIANINPDDCIPVSPVIDHTRFCLPC